MAYFRILVNPLDTDAILRVINVPKRGIGDKTIDIMLDYAQSKGVCLYDSILEVESLDLPAATKNRIKDFKKLIVEGEKAFYKAVASYEILNSKVVRLL